MSCQLFKTTIYQQRSETTSNACSKRARHDDQTGKTVFSAAVIVIMVDSFFPSLSSPRTQSVVSRGREKTRLAGWPNRIRAKEIVDKACLHVVPTGFVPSIVLFFSILSMCLGCENFLTGLVLGKISAMLCRVATSLIYCML